VKRLAALAAVIGAAGAAWFLASPASPASHGPVNSVLVESVPSRALGARMPVRVVLPKGYEPGRRYPVVYFLHGLPAGDNAYLGNNWVMTALDEAGRAILVFPQGAREKDSDPEYLNWGANRNWETFIAEELPKFVDAHFDTIANRSGRAIVGVSAGGYGATVLGLHHLGTFSVIESWSGYFHPTDPTGTKALARGPATSAHTLIANLKSKPTFFGFYVGRSDSRFRAENLRLDRELTAARVAHVFALYPGGHQTSVWKAHAKGWLAMALRRLAAPS
jgi:enterochelin esterase-like enzyme